MQAATLYTLSISRYKEVQEGKNSVTYYILDISKINSQTWRVEKRFKEFDELNHTLKKNYANLPFFPAKSFFTLKGPDIEKRRQELEHYMQIIATRTDIMSSDILKKFLELENFTEDSITNPPKLVSEFPGLVLGVRDFFYQPDEGILFAGLGDMSVTSRMDSFFSNIRMPWDAESEKRGLAIVGSVECYTQTGVREDFKFEKMWSKVFQTQVINVYWDQGSCLLLVSRDDGCVTVLKVSSELNYSKCDEVVTKKLHAARVMGIYIDSVSEFIYSVGEDRKFKVYDLKKNEIISDVKCGTALFTALIPDQENKRIFLSNRNGQVFLYDISSGTPKLIHAIQAHPKGAVRAIHFDNYKNYLMTGNYDDGMVAIIDMQQPDRVKFSHIITHLKGRKKIRCIGWSSNRGEVYTGGEDGAITFWDVKKICPIYVLKAHAFGVNKIQYLPDHNILITGGKDNRLRFYKVPVEWSKKTLEAGTKTLGVGLEVSSARIRQSEFFDHPGYANSLSPDRAVSMLEPNMMRSAWGGPKRSDSDDESLFHRE